MIKLSDSSSRLQALVTSVAVLSLVLLALAGVYHEPTNRKVMHLYTTKLEGIPELIRWNLFRTQDPNEMTLSEVLSAVERVSWDPKSANLRPSYVLNAVSQIYQNLGYEIESNYAVDISQHDQIQSGIARLRQYLSDQWNKQAAVFKVIPKAEVKAKLERLGPAIAKIDEISARLAKVYAFVKEFE